jgi:ribosomal protein L13E
MICTLRVETSSTWKIQVETPAANKQKTAEIVWPQIRLVPQNLKFFTISQRQQHRFGRGFKSGNFL